jgi:capsular exopolysaccharide synthesis family protein
MLDRHLRGVPTKSLPEPSPGNANGEIGLTHIIGFFRRQRVPMLLATGATLLLGIVYLATATSLYTASTSLIIDNRKLAIFGDGDVFGEAVLSNANLESQVQLLLSGKIAETVARKLDLIHDANFMEVRQGLIGTIIGQVAGLFRSSPPTTAAATPDESLLLVRAAAILRSNVMVSRVGLSYVINVSYTAEDSVQAARIANAFTAAYVEDQFNTQVQIAQRGADWLLARIQDLRGRAADESLTAQEKSAVRATYDGFLQRYTEMVQQQSLPTTEARVITAATLGAKTSPKTMLVIAGSLIFGSMLGFGIGLARDLLDRAVRTGQQVETVTGTAFLGYLPRFDVGGFAMRRIAKRAKKMLDSATHKFAAEPAFSVVLTAPFSRFTETLRNIKLAAEKASPGPGSAIVLGVTSSLPNEGKSTVAINLGRLVAQSGGRVLLIDGDLRNGGLSESLVPPETRGLVQLVQGEAQLGELIWGDQATRLQFLPAGADAKLGNANEVLSSSATQALLEACRRQYNFVIVDLPAVLPVVDARAAAHLFDGFVFVVEWGYTSEEVLAQAFHFGGIADKVIGAVLNKVNLGALKRYQDRPAEITGDKYLDSYRHIA